MVPNFLASHLLQKSSSYVSGVYFSRLKGAKQSNKTQKDPRLEKSPKTEKKSVNQNL